MNKFPPRPRSERTEEPGERGEIRPRRLARLDAGLDRLEGRHAEGRKRLEVWFNTKVPTSQVPNAQPIAGPILRLATVKGALIEIRSLTWCLSRRAANSLGAG